jgi:hypothetical protein
LNNKILLWILLIIINIACMSLLLIMSDLDVHVNFFAFFAMNINILTQSFWIFNFMQINDECKIVIFSSLTHDSCSITISTLFFANFMHACIICVDLAQLCCRIQIFNVFAKLSSFALFCKISSVIFITISWLNDLFVSWWAELLDKFHTLSYLWNANFDNCSI